MTLEEALAYIHKVDWRGSVPGLSRIDTLLGLLGHPERSVKYVHVTGTNGKGSTCAMLASVLRAAGYKTGLYTSPYIFRFNERMQIGGVPIPDRGVSRQCPGLPRPRFRRCWNCTAGCRWCRSRLPCC